MIQFDLRIFFNWVGEKPPTRNKPRAIFPFWSAKVAGFKFRFCYAQKTDQSDETLEVAPRTVDVTPVTPITVKRQKLSYSMG